MRYKADAYVGSSQATFPKEIWRMRGLCVRQNNQNLTCHTTRFTVLDNPNQLRVADYNVSVRVLALLRTVVAQRDCAGYVELSYEPSQGMLSWSAAKRWSQSRFNSLYLLVALEFAF